MLADRTCASFVNHRRAGVSPNISQTKATKPCPMLAAVSWKTNGAMRMASDGPFPGTTLRNKGRFCLSKPLGLSCSGSLEPADDDDKADETRSQVGLWIRGVTMWPTMWSASFVGPDGVKPVK